MSQCQPFIKLKHKNHVFCLPSNKGLICRNYHNGILSLVVVVFFLQSLFTLFITIFFHSINKWFNEKIITEVKMRHQQPQQWTQSDKFGMREKKKGCVRSRANTSIRFCAMSLLLRRCSSQWERQKWTLGKQYVHSPSRFDWKGDSGY